jgi:hypothetical protein
MKWCGRWELNFKFKSHTCHYAAAGLWGFETHQSTNVDSYEIGQSLWGFELKLVRNSHFTTSLTETSMLPTSDARFVMIPNIPLCSRFYRPLILIISRLYSGHSMQFIDSISLRLWNSVTCATSAPNSLAMSRRT